MNDTPRPIFDFFIDHEGVEYICEVYTACDGAVEDFTIFPLMEDGSKGPAEMDGFPLYEDDEFTDKLQERYQAWTEDRSFD